MASNNKLFRLTHLIILFLAVIRIFPILFPVSRTWGFNHLNFLPMGYSIGFFIIAAIALILPFLRVSEKLGEALVGWFSRVFYEHRLKYIHRLTAIVVLAIIFILFVMPTHFLGDGYDVIYNLASSAGIHIKWSEIGITQFMIAVQSLIGPQNEQNSRMAFQTVSVASGALTVWFFFLIAGIATEDKVKRLLIVFASMSSGSLLLFFGYAEYYPILWVFISALVFFCLRYIRGGSPVPVWLILLIGTFFHLKMAVFLPAVVYVTFAAGGGRRLYKRHRTILKIIYVLAGAVLLAGFIYKFATDLYIQDMFLPPFIGKPIDPGYAIFSLSHLLDIFNEIMLIAPGILIFVVAGMKNFNTVRRNPGRIFLLLSSIGCMIFLFMVDPKLGMPRDWDLFSFTAFTAAILLVVLIEPGNIPGFGRLVVPVILMVLITPLPFLACNLNRDSSEKYAEYFMRLDFEKSLSTLVVMFDYYDRLGNKSKSDSLKYIYNAAYLNRKISNTVLEALDARQMDKAAALIPRLRQDKYDAGYQRILARYNYLQGNLDKAMEHINRAIQLRRYYAELYWERGVIYMARKEPEKFLKELQKGYRLDNNCIIVLDGLAFMNYSLGNYDSSIYYGEKLVGLGSARASIYYSLAMAYAANGEFNKADSMVAEFAEFVAKDSSLAGRYDELIQAVNGMKTGSE